MPCSIWPEVLPSSPLLFFLSILPWFVSFCLPGDMSQSHRTGICTAPLLLMLSALPFVFYRGMNGRKEDERVRGGERLRFMDVCVPMSVHACTHLRHKGRKSFPPPSGRVGHSEGGILILVNERVEFNHHVAITLSWGAGGEELSRWVENHPSISREVRAHSALKVNRDG